MNEIMIMNAEGAAQAKRIVLLLQNNGIDAYYKSDFPDDILSLIQTDDKDLLSIYVPRDDYFKAKEILKEASSRKQEERRPAKKAKGEKKPAPKKAQPRYESAPRERREPAQQREPQRPQRAARTSTPKPKAQSNKLFGFIPPALFAVAAIVLIALCVKKIISVGLFAVLFILCAACALAIAYLLEKAGFIEKEGNKKRK